jgi:hypothetical protein
MMLKPVLGVAEIREETRSAGFITTEVDEEYYRMDYVGNLRPRLRHRARRLPGVRQECMR